MMRYFILILAALMLMCCGSDKNSDDPESDTATDSVADSETYVATESETIEISTNTPPLNCTDNFVYGVTVEVTDEAGYRVDANVEIVDGTYVEVLEGSGGIYFGSGERTGTYTASVTADGYDTATMEIATLGFDGCHVIPAETVKVVLTKSGE